MGSRRETTAAQRDADAPVCSPLRARRACCFNLSFFSVFISVFFVSLFVFVVSDEREAPLWVITADCTGTHTHTHGLPVCVCVCVCVCMNSNYD